MVNILVSRTSTMVGGGLISPNRSSLPLNRLRSRRQPSRSRRHPRLLGATRASLPVQSLEANPGASQRRALPLVDSGRHQDLV